jgi:hypothetical protein
MADDREALDLGPEDEIEEIETGEEGEDQQEADTAEEEDGEEDDQSETVIGFEGEEEAAPASEGESSVIREMRRKLREKERRIAELESGSAPKRIEVGPKPTLESCEYDEERFETALTDWHKRKDQAEAQDRQQQEREEAEREAWTKRAKAYEANKATLNVSNYEEAEGEVFAALPEQTQALLMLTDKPAALVYALSRNPAKLEQLSKLNLAEAALMIGELKGKLQVKRRALPDPDRPVRGNASPVSADKELARLEAEAERTGDRTKVIRYKREQRQRA